MLRGATPEALKRDADAGAERGQVLRARRGHASLPLRIAGAADSDDISYLLLRLAGPSAPAAYPVFQFDRHEIVCKLFFRERQTHIESTSFDVGA